MGLVVKHIHAFVVLALQNPLAENIILRYNVSKETFGDGGIKDTVALGILFGHGAGIGRRQGIS